MQLSRFGVVGVFGAVLIVIFLGTVIFARWSWYWAGYWPESMVAVGAVFTSGTFALATVAGIIALIAYIRQNPLLTVSVRSPAWEVNQPVFVTNPRNRLPNGSPRLIDMPELTIRISNRRRFSARTPACRVSMRNFAGMTFPQPLESWTVLGRSDGLVDSAQWDGGANYVIHGRWSRDIHLDFSQAAVTRDMSVFGTERKEWRLKFFRWSVGRTSEMTSRWNFALVIEVVADGFQRKWAPLPVEIVAPDVFQRRYPQRRDQLPVDLLDWQEPLPAIPPR